MNKYVSVTTVKYTIPKYECIRPSQLFDNYNSVSIPATSDSDVGDPVYFYDYTYALAAGCSIRVIGRMSRDRFLMLGRPIVFVIDSKLAYYVGLAIVPCLSLPCSCLITMFI